MNREPLHLAQEYAAILRRKLGNQLKQVILFGSQARGVAREGSDYDVVVVVNKRTPSIRDAILDVGVEMMNKYDTLFAALIYDEQEWQQAQGFPLAWNIKQEGIAV